MRVLAHRIARYFSLFLYFKKINFLERLAYRFNFYLFLASVFSQAFFNLFFFKIIFSWVGNLRGWNFHQALLIVATVMLVDGLMWIAFAYVYNLKYQIGNGTLDGILTKPAESQFLVSVYRGDLEDLMRIITGVGVLIFSVSHLDLGGWFLFSNLFWYLLLLFNALVIVYSLALALICVSFWTIDSSMSFFLVESIIRSAQYPTDIFKKGLSRMFFTFGMPLAFLGTVPARVFSSGFDGLWILASSLTALAFFLVSRFIWKKGLAKYSSASS